MVRPGTAGRLVLRGRIPLPLCPFLQIAFGVLVFVIGDDVIGGAQPCVPRRGRAPAVVNQQRDRGGARGGRDRRIPQGTCSGEDHQRHAHRVIDEARLVEAVGLAHGEGIQIGGGGHDEDEVDPVARAELGDDRRHDRRAGHYRRMVLVVVLPWVSARFPVNGKSCQARMPLPGGFIKSNKGVGILVSLAN